VVGADGREQAQEHRARLGSSNGGGRRSVVLRGSLAAEPGHGHGVRDGGRASAGPALRAPVAPLPAPTPAPAAAPPAAASASASRPVHRPPVALLDLTLALRPLPPSFRGAATRRTQRAALWRRALAPASSLAPAPAAAPAPAPTPAAALALARLLGFGVTLGEGVVLLLLLGALAARHLDGENPAAGRRRPPAATSSSATSSFAASHTTPRGIALEQ